MGMSDATPKKLQQHRRHLHQIPELDFDLPQTIQYVRQHLESLGAEILEPAPSTVCAYFPAGAEQTIAFRADMDALPLTEQSDAPYASKHPGRMHACGHDAHMAMMLGFCDEVAQLAAAGELPYNVLAIFQPAEETTGGARGIVESGIFADLNVAAVFGIHMWPGFAAGQLISRPGPLMARTSEVKITVTGRSVHVAKSEHGTDATYAAATLLTRIYQMAEAMPAYPQFLLKFGLLQSGTVCNIISGSALLEGTLRSFDDAVYQHLVSELQRIASEVAEQFGCKIDMDIDDGYPPVLNDPALLDAVTTQTGLDVVELEQPPLTGEDFSFYQQAAPGVFFFLGTGRDEALHTADFDLDESALTAGVDLYRQLLTLTLPK